jgi:formylglycine-generating enzyme required for sulfatase activity/tRNA A-37 threonylcarbamoyl transferase component Bud32
MAGRACPNSSELLAWLQEPLDPNLHQHLADHIDTCDSCQTALEQLDRADERFSVGPDLLEALRSERQPDPLELEPECASAVILAAAALEAHAELSLMPAQQKETEIKYLEALTRQGRYEILEVVGQGGMGVVYKATDRKLNRLVAIKAQPTMKQKDSAAFVRFEREMKTVARLTHPHIVTAHDADQAEGIQFLVMEYIDGQDLKSLVKARGPLSWEEAVRLILQAARGLCYAHEEGIIHRDIKPANLMLDRRGTLKVLDLGLARFELNEERPTELTETGMVMGTLDYMSPEQAVSPRDVDGRTDIYSLGCSLHYLLTGRPPYQGDTAIQKVLAHRETAVPSLRAACPGCPVPLAQVFERMVAKRPQERYQNLAQLIADLEAILGATAGPTSVANSVLLQAYPLSRNKPSWIFRPGKRAQLTVLAFLLFLGVATFWWSGLLDHLVGQDGLAVTGDASSAGAQLRSEPIPSPTLTQGTVAGQLWAGNELKMNFCWCPPGNFRMGSPKNEVGRLEFESPDVNVEIRRGFWMGQYEVTQNEWQRVMDMNPSRFRGEGTLPVENINWLSAKRFCTELTARERARGSIPSDWEFNLPTEAQWEYACRAGSTTAYSFGASTEGLGEHTWYSYNARIRSHEVGQRKPNAWNLYDMHGNVWEWCRDWFQNKLQGGVDPEAKEIGTGRVIRGGGWNCSANLCRTSFRSGQVPEEAGHELGFRVAIVPVSGLLPIGSNQHPSQINP